MHNSRVFVRVLVGARIFNSDTPCSDIRLCNVTLISLVSQTTIVVKTYKINMFMSKSAFEYARIYGEYKFTTCK